MYIPFNICTHLSSVELHSAYASHTLTNTHILFHRAHVCVLSFVRKSACLAKQSIIGSGIQIELHSN